MTEPPRSRRDLVAVVACDGARGIGLDGAIPWRVRADLKHFKTITTTVAARGEDGQLVRVPAETAVIMGRRTWESIPAKFRPLPGRLNVVLSTRMSEGALAGVGARCARDWTCALTLVADVEAAYVIGGAQIYNDAIAAGHCNEVILTRIEGDYGCDVRLVHFEEGFSLRDSWELASGAGEPAARVERWVRGGRDNPRSAGLEERLYGESR